MKYEEVKLSDGTQRAQRSNRTPLLIASQNRRSHLHVHAEQQILENLVVATAVAVRLDEIALASERRSEAQERPQREGSDGIGRGRGHYTWE